MGFASVMFLFMLLNLLRFQSFCQRQQSQLSELVLHLLVLEVVFSNTFVVSISGNETKDAS